MNHDVLPYLTMCVSIFSPDHLPHSGNFPGTAVEFGVSLVVCVAGVGHAVLYTQQCFREFLAFGSCLATSGYSRRALCKRVDLLELNYPDNPYHEM